MFIILLRHMYSITSQISRFVTKPGPKAEAERVRSRSPKVYDQCISYVKYTSEPKEETKPPQEEQKGDTPGVWYS